MLTDKQKDILIDMGRDLNPYSMRDWNRTVWAHAFVDGAMATEFILAEHGKDIETVHALSV